ncbi:AAA family ATPase [bacterium]|nr:AAA family ATPase [bacterium]
MSNLSWNDLYKDPLAAQVAINGRTKNLSLPEERAICFVELGTTDIEGTYSSGCRISEAKVKEYMLSQGWKLRRHSSNIVLDFKPFRIDSSNEIWINTEKKLMLTLVIIKSNIENYRKALEGEEKEINVIQGFEVYYPTENRQQAEQDASELFEVFHQNTIEIETESTVGIISQDPNAGYYVKSFSLRGKIPKFEHVDEHYGEGFAEFHSKMIKRITDETKGLILFHGEPGTGKTQYIRMLLEQLTKLNKSILYVPPGFSDHLTDPAMIEFISDWVFEEDRDCILLIEDAEPLLESRSNGNVRSTGISNLLNMTDGILNDMLGLMVIATFNTSISKIDTALLRPQRLIARKEFCKISEGQAKKLAKALGIKLPKIEYPATLAEFYTSSKQQEVLFHTIVEEKKIGFFK